MGLENSPRLKATFENILAAKRNTEVQKSGYLPRVDAYAELSKSIDDSGYDGDTNEQAVGLTFSWNLFRGFQDKSKQAQAVEETYFAKDIREKVCREVRQDLSISFNEYHRLAEQLRYQKQHVDSTDNVRVAFRDQFDIGQRTLLDVLDIETEFYTARRDYVNSELDLMIANAKYLSTAGELLNTLNLANLDMTPPEPVTEPDADMLGTCPAEVVGRHFTDKEALYADRRPASQIPQAVKQVIKAAKPVVLYGVNFDFDSDRLRPMADEKLRPVVDFANQYPDADIEVIGHTDWVGTDEYNMDLSARRADSVRRWLLNHGVADNRMKVRYMGESQPIATNETSEGRAENRRVEVHYTIFEEREVEVPAGQVDEFSAGNANYQF